MGLSEARVRDIIPAARQYIAMWREYPDLMVDFMQDGGNPEVKRSLEFYSYQRVFVRAIIRHKYAFATFPRAYSKSFLCVLVLTIRCILYPGSKLFCTSGGKEQAASILKEKMDELCSLIPSLARELNEDKTKQGRDYCCFYFKNGSYFD